MPENQPKIKRLGALFTESDLSVSVRSQGGLYATSSSHRRTVTQGVKVYGSVGDDEGHQSHFYRFKLYFRLEAF